MAETEKIKFTKLELSSTAVAFSCSESKKIKITTFFYEQNLLKRKVKSSVHNSIREAITVQVFEI
jgi:predicted transcriptional regulator